VNQGVQAWQGELVVLRDTHKVSIMGILREVIYFLGKLSYRFTQSTV
jgi:hypothetical protein